MFVNGNAKLSKVGTSIFGNLTPDAIVADDSINGSEIGFGRVNNSFLSCRLQSKRTLSMASVDVSSSSPSSTPMDKRV